MSSSNRGGDRHASDAYFTPRWCLRRLLESDFWTTHLRPSGGPLRIMDPMAGRGRFLEVFQTNAPQVAMPFPHVWRWTQVEIRPEEKDALVRLATNGHGWGGGDVYIADILKLAPTLATHPHHDLAITNPAFPVAFEALLALLPICRRVTFLQRRNWLGSEERADFFRTHMPDEQTLPNRPCFTLNAEGKPATDSIEYSFFTFHGAETKGAEIPLRPYGMSSILGSTSKAERRVEIDELIAEDRRLRLSSTTPKDPPS